MCTKKNTSLKVLMQPGNLGECVPSAARATTVLSFTTAVPPAAAAGATMKRSLSSWLVQMLISMFILVDHKENQFLYIAYYFCKIVVFPLFYLLERERERGEG
mmetsp:Transcript_43615/g.48867  ORF Transcript_43615/g.48867 Transcript_43615/m.48867 type:complete len:103 (+) Transcript_43615:1303-1611(+)